MECLDLEKFSVINRFAKFHGRGQSDSAETASTSDVKSSVHKPFLQRYVTALPMPRSIPDWVQCLSLWLLHYWFSQVSGSTVSIFVCFPWLYTGSCPDTNRIIVWKCQRVDMKPSPQTWLRLFDLLNLGHWCHYWEIPGYSSCFKTVRNLGCLIILPTRE